MSNFPVFGCLKATPAGVSRRRAEVSEVSGRANRYNISCRAGITRAFGESGCLFKVPPGSERGIL